MENSITKRIANIIEKQATKLGLLKKHRLVSNSVITDHELILSKLKELGDKYAEHLTQNTCDHNPIEKGAWYECSKCGEIL